MKFSTKSVGTYLSMLAMTFFSLSAMAQLAGENIVPNGSFESVEKKPKRLGKIEQATGWVSPTGVRADLFVDGNVEEIGTPMNVYGKELAKEGENYAGIVAYSYGDKVDRSYLMTKLNMPMKKGMRYCVKFNISLAEASKYASNNVAMFFSKRALGTDDKGSLIEEAGLKHVENDYSTFSGRYNWTEVCGMYTAEGGEKYIVIGNFDANDNTRYERMKKDPKVKDVKVDQIMAAYYYIDDVSVALVDVERGEKCDCAIEGAGEAYSNVIYQKVVTLSDEMTPTERVEAQQIFFSFGKDKISAEGEKTLDDIANVMKANPESKLKINGHCNPEEVEAGMENEMVQDMDNKRIGAVMLYLMDKGVEESRLIPARKGSNSPNEAEISENDDEEMRQAKSRRVTFELK